MSQLKSSWLELNLENSPNKLCHIQICLLFIGKDYEAEQFMAFKNINEYKTS